jgi:hypothetical protein
MGAEHLVAAAASPQATLGAVVETLRQEYRCLPELRPPLCEIKGTQWF